MMFRLKEVDDEVYLILDGEGIDYLERGLEQLREAEPGDTFSTPSVGIDDDEVPDSVGEFYLERA